MTTNGWRGVLWKAIAAVVIVIVLGVLTAAWTMFTERGQIQQQIGALQRDVNSLGSKVSSLQENVKNIGTLVAEIHARMGTEGWESYSGWRWQIDMDRIFCRELNLEPGDYPEPPAFLRERPGYNGP
jgi:hypothetical protein